MPYSSYSGPRYGKSVGPRDTQRQRVYDTEGAIPRGQTFDTVAAMQAYVDKLLASAYARRRWGNRSITVKPGFGHRRATGGNGVIQMPTWARYEEILLHEVAHCLTAATVKHGPEFVRVLIDLAEHAYGEDAVKPFREACRTKRVKIGPPLVLRSAERTPPPRVVVTDKLWRIEYKLDGKLVQTTRTAPNMQSALSAFWLDLALGVRGGQVTNLRCWRGVAARAVAAKKKGPAKK